MKKLVVTMVVMMVAISSIAQVKMPDWFGQVVIVNSDSTTTVLEKEPGTIKAKGSGLGMIPVVGVLEKTKSFLIIKGESSKNIFPAGRLTFIVKMGENDKDPRNMFGVLKFEVKKKNRQYQMGEFGLIGGSKINMDFSNVPFEVTKYNADSYMVVIENAEPGQYAFYIGDLSKISTFGVK